MVREFTLVQINEATNNFSKENFINKGGEGEVYKGDIQIDTSKTKTTVAVKKLSYSETHEFDKEIELLKNLRHANLVALHGFCRENGNKILVYEYLHNGNLREKLKQNRSLTWMQCLNICYGVARGLDHLHSGASTNHLIIHRDIKPENILLDENLNAKVSDFGISKKATLDQSYSTVAIATRIAGTRGYYAPELLLNAGFSKRTDVYAFGVVLFEVLCKKAPPSPTLFRDPDKDGNIESSVAQMAWNNLDCDLYMPIHELSIRSFIDITERCLSDDPNRRPTMSKVVSNLEKVIKNLRGRLRAVSLPTSSKSGNYLHKDSSLPTSAKQAASAQSTRPPSSEKFVKNHIQTMVPRPTRNSITSVSEINVAIEDDKIVLYYSSYTLIGKISNDCKEVLSTLKKYDQVEKRDVSRKESYRVQLQEAFKGKVFRLPQLFIGGCHAGGIDEILQLYKSGELDELFNAFPATVSTSTVSKFYLAGEEDKIVLYHTSFSLAGKVHDNCKEVLSILKEYDQVEKRDVSRKKSYSTQIQEAFKGNFFRLPQLFIGGRHAGGYDHILQLFKSGKLQDLFKALKF